MKFIWNPTKADTNRQKHGVGFDEAATVFGAPLAGTFPDFDHSIGVSRVLLLLACHAPDDCWWLPILKAPKKFASLVPNQPLPMGEKLMNNEESKDELRPEYDFDFSKAV